LLLKLALDGGAVRLGSAAAEVGDMESSHTFILTQPPSLRRKTRVAWGRRTDHATARRNSTGNREGGRTVSLPPTLESSTC
jgi:hypothetical protein